MDPAQEGYDESRTTVFYDQIESRVRALSGVKSASLASYVPMGGYPTKATVFIQGQPVLPGRQAPLVPFNRVDSAYFQTMGITLLRGRTFMDSDNKTSPRVAIVNETMASIFWPHEDALGKLFRIGSETAQPVEVVGVSSNGKYLAINENSLPFFYVPLAQDFVSRRALQIRAFAAPESLEVSVKDRSPNWLPAFRLRT